MTQDSANSATPNPRRPESSHAELPRFDDPRLEQFIVLAIPMSQPGGESDLFTSAIC